MIHARCADLMAIADPYQTPPWRGLHALTRAMIRDAIATRTFEPLPVGSQGDVARHVARIAWLVENGWADPIQIDVGCPSFPGWRPFWPITDGNHRFAAALYREDATIALEWGGEVARARTLFGADLIDAEGLRAADDDLDRPDGATIVSA
jgi:hypothetical protein